MSETNEKTKTDKVNEEIQQQVDVINSYNPAAMILERMEEEDFDFSILEAEHKSVLSESYIKASFDYAVWGKIDEAVSEGSLTPNTLRVYADSCVDDFCNGYISFLKETATQMKRDKLLWRRIVRKCKLYRWAIRHQLIYYKHRLKRVYYKFKRLLKRIPITFSKDYWWWRDGVKYWEYAKVFKTFPALDIVKDNVDVPVDLTAGKVVYQYTGTVIDKQYRRQAVFNRYELKNADGKTSYAGHLSWYDYTIENPIKYNGPFHYKITATAPTLSTLYVEIAGRLGVLIKDSYFPNDYDFLYSICYSWDKYDIEVFSNHYGFTIADELEEVVD